MDKEIQKQLIENAPTFGWVVTAHGHNREEILDLAVKGFRQLLDEHFTMPAPDTYIPGSDTIMVSFKVPVILIHTKEKSDG